MRSLLSGVAGIIITLALLGIIPLGLYLAAQFSPATARPMRDHPGIVLAAMITGTALLFFAFHVVVVDPCRATTNLHTVTTNLGNPYETYYKDSGEWCLWVRGTF
jgi:hypothetical protein